MRGGVRDEKLPSMCVCSIPLLVHSPRAQGHQFYVKFAKDHPDTTVLTIHDVTCINSILNGGVSQGNFSVFLSSSDHTQTHS